MEVLTFKFKVIHGLYLYGLLIKLSGKKKIENTVPIFSPVPPTPYLHLIIIMLPAFALPLNGVSGKKIVEKITKIVPE